MNRFEWLLLISYLCVLLYKRFVVWNEAGRDRRARKNRWKKMYNNDTVYTGMDGLIL